MAAVPEQGAQEGEQTGETVGPLTAPSQKAQQDMDQQRSPDLPLDRVFVVTGEIAKSEGLLDVFEEGFNAPAALSHAPLIPMRCVNSAGSKQHHAAPRTDIARHPVCPVRPREFRNKARGNGFTNLSQYGIVSIGPLGHDRFPVTSYPFMG